MAVAAGREVPGFLQKHGEKTEEMASVSPTLNIIVTYHALAAHQTMQRLGKGKLWVMHGCNTQTCVLSLQNVEVLLESIMDAAEVLERSNEDAKVTHMLSSIALCPQTA